MHMRGTTNVLLALAIGLAALLSAATAIAQDGRRLALEAAKNHAQGKLDQALAQFTDALRDTSLPNDQRAMILNDRGAVLARLNQPKAALDDFNRAVQIYPEYPGVYNNRGSTLLTIGLPLEAIKDFDRALLLAPGYVAAYNNRASANLLLKRYPQAIHDFTRAIELYPNTPAALSGRGKVHLANDRPQSALRDFTRAVEIDARSANAYLNRAKAKVLAEQYADAVEDLSRAIAFNPSDPAMYLERGNAYLAAQDTAAAIKDFSKALELAPRIAAAIEARAFAHIQLEAFAEAEADILHLLEIDPRSGPAHAARALLYLRTGQAQLAQREIARAQNFNSAHPDVLWTRGAIEEAAGKQQAATASYRAALAARPEMRPAALALERLGASRSTGPEVPLAELGVGAWRLARRGGRYIAMTDDLPRLEVPIEPVGDGHPRLLAWEVKEKPFDDIGLLRFSTGRVPTPAGPADTEHVALINVRENRLLGLVPHRQGAKTAKWSWGDGKLVVASVDGLTDEFALVDAKQNTRSAATAAAAAAAAASARRRRTNDFDFNQPGWIPWDTGPPPRSSRRTSSRQKKPKTLFDLIFGN